MGDDAYAAEELVAKPTAAFLCAPAIPGHLRHPEYIAHWLKVLGGDNKAIFTAAGKATEVANHMRALANPEEDDASATVSE